ncbi:GSCFA domain-containing protein [Seonamhaeicola sp. ML3]|uniref:GSCFA domain-containing protein n=1 Tax=Seonamhaeicola sp. ML3 TaxID=2937786 RepID=UPI00200CB6D1|nr:GSCFA domain-containing protein [Seonamhaeicola sp. ML3]
MNLQTKIPLPKRPNNLIGYESNILLLGSCFVENIGEKLDYFKFKNLINPFGVLFNPKAIEALVRNSVQGKVYSEVDIFQNNEQWHCFDAHSKLSNSSKPGLLNDLNEQVTLTANQLKNASHVIITLGTAWVYRNKESNNVVANCHKMSQNVFSKELLSVDEVLVSLKAMVDSIREVNPDVSIIFTVSPVRHLKDGFVENTQSKAHLITAIHKLLSTSVESGGLHYFPSYEIMMDELRDYRFYTEDMIHPNQTAIDYIWGKFKEVWIASVAQKTMDDVCAVQKGLLHKPFNPNSEAHQKFLRNLKQKQKDLKAQFQHISF